MYSYRPYAQRQSVVFNLIAINVLVFIVSLLMHDFMIEWLALFYPASPSFKPLQLVGHMFMHGNFMHIFSNMFALFMFGSVLERVWGPERFLIFYFVTGFGAALLHLGVYAWIVYNFTGSVAPDLSMVMDFETVYNIYTIPTVGASGAVFGLLTAFGVLFPNTELYLFFIPIPIRAKYFVSMYVIWELVRGIQMNPNDNVAHFAHLGGALFGYILVRMWRHDRRYFY
ncbi:MAG: rhomboid family intramembrane serine protease [Chitinophagales bacterium]|nr:rhomboid family intramembrane serine protease [Chitinophagales bacterium]MDW8418453.1 rhomboid family intramembrane serine protease [Chitinophagales bacterium]